MIVDSLIVWEQMLLVFVIVLNAAVFTEEASSCCYGATHKEKQSIQQQTQHCALVIWRRKQYSNSDVAPDLHLAEERVPPLGDDLPRGGVGDEDVRAGVGALVAERPGGDAEGVPGRRGGEVDEVDGHVDGDLEMVAVGHGGGGADLVHQGHHGAGGYVIVAGGEACGDREGAEDVAWADALHADPLQREPLEEAGAGLPPRGGGSGSNSSSSVQRVHQRAILIAHPHLQQRLQ